ncbi:MAG: tetratricopeptide repeat protein [Desulfatirhabdiaceae bacterium]
MNRNQEITTLRKAKRLDEATRLARESLAQMPGDYAIEKAYGWVIYDQLKQALGQLEHHDITPDRLIAVTDDFISEYTRFKHIRRPDLSHSLILNMILKIVKAHGWPNFLWFAQWWNPECFGLEDQQPFKTPSGKVIPSLRLRYFYAIGRSLVTGSEKGLPANDWAKETFEKALQQYPDDHWLHYYKSELLIRQGRHTDARDHMLPVMKRQQRAAWAWDQFGDTWVDESLENGIICFQYAIALSNKPEMALTIRRKLAEFLAMAGRHDEAAHHVKMALDIRQQMGFSIPADLAQLARSQWYRQSKPKACIHISELQARAHGLLCTDLITRLGVVDNQNPEKQLAHVAFSVTDGMLIRYTQFTGIHAVPVGTVIEVACDKSATHKPVRWKIAAQSSIPGLFETFQGILEIASGKPFGFVRRTDGGIVFVPPAVMQGYSGKTKTDVRCRAILSLDRTKNRQGWRALFIQPVA